MPSQKLRLEAEMKDNASPAVKQLRAELSALQAASAEVNGTAKLNAELAKLQKEAEANASPAVRKLRAELAELQKGTAAQQAVASLNKEIAALRRQSGEIAPTAGMKAFGGWMGEAKTAATGVMGAIGGVAEVLGPIGIGALGAGAAVSSLAVEMKRLGEQSLAMKELSRETGISLDFVNRWSHAGEHFAVSGDTMRGMLDRFTGQLPDFNRGVGGMFKEFAQWPDLVRKMQHEGPAEALLDAFRQAEQVGREKGPLVQKQFLDAIGLGPEAAKLMGDHGLVGLMDQLNKSYANPSPALLKEAQALRDAGISLNNDFERLENTVAPGFLKVLSTGVSGIDLLIKGWVWEFDKIAAVWESLSKAVKTGSGPRSDGPDIPDELPGLEHKSSYNGSGSGGLLHNTAFTTDAAPSPSSQFGVRGLVADGSKEGVLAALREWSLQSDAKGGLGGGSGDGSGGAGGGGVSGYGVGRKGFMAHGGQFGGSEVGGSAGGTPSKSLLDFIAQSEGTKGYNTSLGFGKFLPGGHETNLEGMSLKEVLKLGDYMRHQPGNPNSSALGRYQITGQTIRDLMGRMHLSGDEKFDAKMQDAMASKLIQDEGPRALGRWASLTGPKMSTAQGLLRAGQIASVPRDAFTSAGAGVGAGGTPVDIALALRGAGESDAGRALGHYMHSGEWCADFVNGALAKAGGKGTGNALARSFFQWGHHVDAGGIHKGDVLVSQGHVGLAEGPAQMHNGRMMVPMIAGNSGRRSLGRAAVRETWESLDKYEARRADNPALAAAPHPDAGRRASGLPGTAHAARDGDSNHLLTIDLRDPGGHVKSTRIERNGPMKVDMPNRWQTGRNPLIGA